MQFFIIGFLALSVAGSDHVHAIERSRRETSEATNSSSINPTDDTNVEITSANATDASTKVTAPITSSTSPTTEVPVTDLVTFTDLETTTTEPATETATTKATSAATETDATATSPAVTPAALSSNTTAVDEKYYYGCGQGHWDGDEGMRQNNTCRFLCNCGFEKDANGEETKVPLECDPTTGQCINNACPDGFEGEKCQDPICAVDCGAEGVCVHKHQCVCTNLYTRVTEQIVHEKHGDIIVHRCTNLRIDGLKGALCALVVLIVSISACACLHSVSQKRMKAYSYVDDSHM